jgi:hypothetical protein
VVHKVWACSFCLRLIVPLVAAALCCACGTPSEPVSCDVIAAGRNYPEWQLFRINGSKQCKVLIEDPLEHSRQDSHPTVYTIFGDIAEKYADGKVKEEVGLFEPLGRCEVRGDYRIADFSLLAEYLDAKCQFLIAQVLAAGEMSVRTEHPWGTVARISSLSITFRTDGDADVQEFHVTDVAECERLMAPVFERGAVIKPQKDVRTLGSLVVAYRDGRQVSIDLVSPFGTVRVGDVTRKVDLSGLRQYVIDKCKYIAAVCQEARDRPAKGRP